MPELSKDKRIAKEKKRLLKIMNGLDENKLSIVKALIVRAAFITVSLEDLEDDLATNGWTEEYQNGEYQSGIKKSASADVHISLTKNLNAIIKQLIELVPAAQRKSKLEEMRKR